MGMPVLVGGDTYAIFEEQDKTVYFERNITASKTVKCRKPGGYTIPDGYREIDGPNIWPKQPNAGWVV